MLCFRQLLLWGFPEALRALGKASFEGFLAHFSSFVTGVMRGVVSDLGMV